MYLTFAILVAPILFFMLIWVVVTAYRIYFPEKPLPYEQDPLMVRRRQTRAGHAVAVGLREIREDQRARREALAPVDYHYTDGFSLEGLPADWMEDLWLRRN